MTIHAFAKKNYQNFFCGIILKPPKNPWVFRFCIDTLWLLLWGIYYRRTWMNLSLSGMSIPYEKIVKPCLHMVVQSTYMICQQCTVRIGCIALRRLMSDAHIGAQDHLQHFDSDMWAPWIKTTPKVFPQQTTRITLASFSIIHLG